jgi:hypothetical protein
MCELCTGLMLHQALCISRQKHVLGAPLFLRSVLQFTTAPVLWLMHVLVCRYDRDRDGFLDRQVGHKN